MNVLCHQQCVALGTPRSDKEECLEEAKQRAHANPSSNRSWNHCWLILSKIPADNHIPVHAQAQAVRPEMIRGDRLLHHRGAWADN